MTLIRCALTIFAIAIIVCGDARAEQMRPANRLLGEASPYLRQHARNAVDWYPWGKEAFDKARRENKPVLLSVGYSTCHWCHVMARESYENRAIAKLLNSHFVAIKVDRERRPAVDETYMLATQLLTGHGGWPNNVFLTPDRKPFFSGTYFPQAEFKSILKRIADLWRNDRPQLNADADKLAEIITAIMTKRVAAAELTPQAIDRAGAEILKKLDVFQGGFTTAPKFPQAPLLMFLLRLAEKDGTAQALSAATLTLDHMLNGGIHDHVGGGFHRYAVDAQWRTPHFEKMLFTQAQLSRVLLRAYRLTCNPRYARTAQRTLDYVLADMTHEGGAFFSARDADSEGADGAIEEGAYYVWTLAQFRSALGDADAGKAEKIFGLEASQVAEGKAVLHLPLPLDELAASLGLERTDLEQEIEHLRARLAEVRAKRPSPKRDDKIVAAWNGMMISAFAEAASVLDDPKYREAALRAAGFVWTKLFDGVRLKRIYFDGRADTPGTQSDYAHTALAFIALYDLTNDRHWLERAGMLADRMHQLFNDPEAGDYVMTETTETIGRVKMRSDSSMPSGNAVALDLFAMLSYRRAQAQDRVRGEAVLAALSGIAIETPSNSGYALLSGDKLLRGESGPRRYLAKGAVRATAGMDRTKGRLNIRLVLDPGWHINAHEPLEENFVATTVSLKELPKAVAVYPEPVRRKLGFHKRELALYEGRIDLKILLPSDLPPTLRAKLTLQACNDRMCLEPETVELVVPVGAISEG